MSCERVCSTSYSAGGGREVRPATHLHQPAMYNDDGYNLSSRLGSLLSLPSRFVARIRKIDEDFNHDLERHSIATAAMSNRIHRMASDNSPSYEFVAMPGPWAFVTSGYAVGLLVMVSGEAFSLSLYCAHLPHRTGRGCFSTEYIILSSRHTGRLHTD